MNEREFELIRQAQGGDVHAFEELVRLHDREVMALIQSVTRNFEDSCDVYQETFLRAYRKIGSYRFESDFRYWLGRIAMNMSLNHYRRKQRQRRYTTSLEEAEGKMVNPESQQHSASSGELRLLDGDLRSHIERCVKQLPAQQRTVFILKHHGGYRIREIAEFMNCAEGTVKNHLFRATHKLKAVLAPYYRGTEERNDS